MTTMIKQKTGTNAKSTKQNGSGSIIGSNGSLNKGLPESIVIRATAGLLGALRSMDVSKQDLAGALTAIKQNPSADASLDYAKAIQANPAALQMLASNSQLSSDLAQAALSVDQSVRDSSALYNSITVSLSIGIDDLSYVDAMCSSGADLTQTVLQAVQRSVNGLAAASRGQN